MYNPFAIGDILKIVGESHIATGATVEVTKADSDSLGYVVLEESIKSKRNGRGVGETGSLSLYDGIERDFIHVAQQPAELYETDVPTTSFSDLFGG